LHGLFRARRNGFVPRERSIAATNPPPAGAMASFRAIGLFRAAALFGAVGSFGAPDVTRPPFIPPRTFDAPTDRAHKGTRHRRSSQSSKSQ